MGRDRRRTRRRWNGEAGGEPCRPVAAECDMPHSGRRMTVGTWPRRAALLFAMLFPSLATYLYFVAFAGHPAMRIVFATGKLAQFSFPLVWLVLVERRRPRFFAGGTRGAGTGLA